MMLEQYGQNILTKELTTNTINEAPVACSLAAGIITPTASADDFEGIAYPITEAFYVTTNKTGKPDFISVGIADVMVSADVEINDELTIDALNAGQMKPAVATEKIVAICLEKASAGNEARIYIKSNKTVVKA
ncbi:hypothetical protein HNP86_001940 [Methanococcus maripaludis]|uniref:Uncharacterized protein n=1 Tax=Methanococcus maripaludis TaxID=39152 RepID=A0A7J9NWV5_METMI|nr:hypothetical protein [Methanococcus maripaludis]MBA2851781.1 hypothetical protein [Methanococcus maripaludis]